MRFLWKRGLITELQCKLNLSRRPRRCEPPGLRSAQNGCVVALLPLEIELHRELDEAGILGSLIGTELLRSQLDCNWRDLAGRTKRAP
jgi:hypothetical protein